MSGRKEQDDTYVSQSMVVAFYAGMPCQNLTLGSCRDDPSKRPFATFSSYAYCTPCLVREALAQDEFRAKEGRT